MKSFMLTDIPEFSKKERIVVVGIIGKSPFRYPNKTTPLVPSVASDENGIECHWDERRAILFLHVISYLDTKQLATLAANLDENSNTTEKDADASHWLVAAGELAAESCKAMALIFHLCHVVVLSSPTSVFDLGYLQLFKAIDAYRTELTPQTTAALNALGGAWESHGRSCCPRLLFHFRRAPRALRRSPAALKRLEHAVEDQLYFILRKARIITNVCAKSLFAIPKNEEFVYISADESHCARDVSALVRGLVQRCAGPDLAPPWAADRPPPFTQFLQGHVDLAFAEGFDDNVGKYAMSTSFFELPTAVSWRSAAQALLPLYTAHSQSEEGGGALYDALATDVRFSQARCAKVLPIAQASYAEGLPAHYSSQHHAHKVSVALGVLHTMARGPVAGAARARLRAACQALWRARSLCEEPSLTNHPCIHPVHDNTKEHSSGVRYISACNCGRSKCPRDDPYTVRAANCAFYAAAAAECGVCPTLHSVAFPVFAPSTPSYRAASVKGGSQEAEPEARASDGNSGCSAWSAPDALSPGSAHGSEEDEVGPQYLVPVSGSNTEKVMTRQPSTTEYLPGMLHTASPPGLLPAFSSWSLVCLGASSLYSHSPGLPEHLQPGFLPHTNYLLPWDAHVRMEQVTAWRAAQASARGRGKGAAPHHLTVKIFIGFEYECPRGHRFMMSSPDTVAHGGGGGCGREAGAAGARLAAADMPLHAPCLCRAAAMLAQLARVHVVTPKAPVHVTLDPRVSEPRSTDTAAAGARLAAADMPLHAPCLCRAAAMLAQLARVHVVTPKAPVHVTLDPRVSEPRSTDTAAAGARLAAADMPLHAPCLCRAAAMLAQLARVHVVTPKAPVHVTLDPRVSEPRSTDTAAAGARLAAADMPLHAPCLCRAAAMLAQLARVHVVTPKAPMHVTLDPRVSEPRSTDTAAAGARLAAADMPLHAPCLCRAAAMLAQLARVHVVTPKAPVHVTLDPRVSEPRSTDTAAAGARLAAADMPLHAPCLCRAAAMLAQLARVHVVTPKAPMHVTLDPRVSEPRSTDTAAAGARLAAADMPLHAPCLCRAAAMLAQLARVHVVTPKAPVHVTLDPRVSEPRSTDTAAAGARLAAADMPLHAPCLCRAAAMLAQLARVHVVTPKAPVHVTLDPRVSEPRSTDTAAAGARLAAADMPLHAPCLCRAAAMLAQLARVHVVTPKAPVHVTLDPRVSEPRSTDTAAAGARLAAADMPLHAPCLCRAAAMLAQLARVHVVTPKAPVHVTLDPRVSEPRSTDTAAAGARLAAADMPLHAPCLCRAAAMLAQLARVHVVTPKAPVHVTLDPRVSEPRSTDTAAAGARLAAADMPLHAPCLCRAAAMLAQLARVHVVTPKAPVHVTLDPRVSEPRSTDTAAAGARLAAADMPLHAPCLCRAAAMLAQLARVHVVTPKAPVHVTLDPRVSEPRSTDTAAAGARLAAADMPLHAPCLCRAAAMLAQLARVHVVTPKAPVHVTLDPRVSEPRSTDTAAAGARLAAADMPLHAPCLCRAAAMLAQLARVHVVTPKAPVHVTLDPRVSEPRSTDTAAAGARLAAADMPLHAPCLCRAAAMLAQLARVHVVTPKAPVHVTLDPRVSEPRSTDTAAAGARLAAADMPLHAPCLCRAAAMLAQLARVHVVTPKAPVHVTLDPRVSEPRSTDTAAGGARLAAADMPLHAPCLCRAAAMLAQLARVHVVTPKAPVHVTLDPRVSEPRSTDTAAAGARLAAADMPLHAPCLCRAAAMLAQLARVHVVTPKAPVHVTLDPRVSEPRSTDTAAAGARLAAADMPLHAPCLCRAAAMLAQLARVHVVTPKAPVHVTLDPRVQPVANGPIFIPQPTGSPPIELTASAYWVLRLPHTYADERGPLPRPRAPHTAGLLLAPLFGLRE